MAASICLPVSEELRSYMTINVKWGNWQADYLISQAENKLYFLEAV